MLALYRAGADGGARGLQPRAARAARRRRARPGRATRAPARDPRPDPRLGVERGASRAPHLPAPLTGWSGGRRSSPSSTHLAARPRAARDADRPGGTGKTRLALAAPTGSRTPSPTACSRGPRHCASRARALDDRACARRRGAGERPLAETLRAPAGAALAAPARQLRGRRRSGPRRRPARGRRARGAGHEPLPAPPHRRARGAPGVATAGRRDRALHDDERRLRAPRFAPSRRERRATLAEICRRLDGLPLALELAAARTSWCRRRRCWTRLDRRLAAAERRHARPARAAADAARHDRLELRPARSRGADAVRGGWRCSTAAARRRPPRRSDGARRDMRGGARRRAASCWSGGAPRRPRFAMLETVREYAWNGSRAGRLRRP